MILNYSKENGININDFFTKQKLPTDINEDEFNTFKQLMKETGDSAYVIAEQLDNKVNPAIVDYANTTEVSNMSMKGLIKHTKTANKSIGTLGIASKATAIGVGILNSVLSSSIAFLAGLVINGVINFFDKLHESQEELIKSANEAKTVINELNESLKTNQKFVNTSSQRYAELAQGVNQFTGENLSLNTEEYEEFLDLSNQLAEVFPSLARNYTENGDAIIQLTGGVDTIVSSLNNLVKVQQELANQEIIKNLPKIYESYGNNVDIYKGEIEELYSKIDDIPKHLETILQSPNTYHITDHANMGEYDSALNSIDANYTSTTKMDEMGYGGFVTYNFDVDELQEQATAISNEYKKAISDLELKIQQENQELQNYFFAFLSTNWNYSQMSTSMQSAVQSVVNTIDWTNVIYNGELISSWEQAEEYITSNIINILNNTSEKTKQAFSNLLSIDRSTLSTADFISQYHSLINQIIEEANMSDEEAIDFRVRFNYIIEDDVEALNKARKKISLTRTNTEVLKEKDEWLKTLSPSDLELFLTLTVDKETSLDGLKSALEDAREIVDKYTKVDISSTIESLGNLQSIYQTLHSAVQEYNETQGLSLDTVTALLQLDDRYLSTLINEDGQLKLNTESFNALTQAKLYDLEVDTITNTLSLIESLKTENDALVALKENTINLAGAKWEDVEATIEQARATLLLKQAEGEDVANRLEALDMIEQSAENKEKIFDTAKNTLVTSTNAFYKVTTPSSNSKKDNVFDWIANSITNVEREIDNLNDKLANASLADKLAIYDQLTEANKKLISSTKSAASAYEKEWNKQSSKISPAYKTQIMSGSTFKLENFSNETTYNNITNAQKAYEQWQSMLQSYNNALQQQEDNDEAKIGTLLEIANLKLEILGLEDSEGLSAKDRNAILEKEKLLKKEILDYNLLLATSEEERIRLQMEYNKYLKDNDEQQYDNTKSERNNEISYHDTKIQDVQNRIALKELQGGHGSQKDYEIMNYHLGEQKALEQANYDAAYLARKGFKYGSDKWNEYNDQMQEAQNNINACTQAQIENNRAILLLPVKEIEEENEKLEEQLGTWEKYKSKVENAIGYATNLVQEQIDILNESKETISDYWDEKIKAVQDEKDAFTESNDELQRQIDLENAKYNLEKAMRNKTVRVYRKGEGFVYESDAEAVRNAQQDLDQKNYDITVSNFDKTIDSLNEQKENAIKPIDEQIKSWTKYAENIDKVINSYENLISMQDFFEVFGNDALSSVLSMDTGILDTFQTKLNEAKLETDTIQAKIDANQLTIQAIQKEAEGALTTASQVELARKNIKDLITNNEEEIQAIDERKIKTTDWSNSWTTANSLLSSSMGYLDSTHSTLKDSEALILDERKKKLEEFKDAAVNLYKEIAMQLNNSTSSFKSLESILANAKNTYQEILDYHSKAEGKGLSSANIVFDDLPKYHNGGIVKSSNKLPENLIALTDENLKPNETIAKLLNGEVVLNNKQMGNMFDNIIRTYPSSTPLNKRENSLTNISIGDVNVYNPDNTDMIVDEIVKELPLKVIQKLHSK